MTLKSKAELLNSKELLHEFEERYEARKREVPADPHVHELSLQSLKRTINRLKEEITLFEIQGPSARPQAAALKNDQELANTLEKLGELESRYEELRNETGGNKRVRELTMHSLKKYINQLTEEATLYRIHHTVGKS